MATIVTRAGKGSPLTNAEVDANFVNLNTELGQKLVASSNLSDLTSAPSARTNLGLAIGTNVQAWDADLDAIAGLAGTSGFLKKTAANTWTLDTSSYLTGNQSISISGDASGSGATSISLTLAASGVTAGTYTKLTVDAKGRATAGAALSSADLPTYTGTLTSGQITTGLGFTPYNSTNPSGYITSSALSPYALLASPALTGTPTAPTAAVSTDTTQIATTAYVNAKIANDAPTKTGGGASGTWGIGITGNAGTVTNGVYTTGDQTIGGQKTFSAVVNNSSGRYTTSSTGVGMYEMHLPGFAARAWYLDTAGVTRLAYTNGGGTASTILLTIDTGGNFTASGNVTAYSDERLKQNWSDLPADFVEQLALVKHGLYDRVGEELRQVGVGAQSLQRLLPEAVLVGMDQQKTLSVAYGNAALASAIQLAIRVVQQDKRIAALEAIVIGDN